MRRITFYALSVAFLAAGMSSCGKTTRGKMINDWKVESSISEETSLNTDGNKLVTTEVIMDNAVTTRHDHTFPGGDSSETSSFTGKVNVNSWAIKKDGTWTWTKEIEYTEGGGQKVITEQSGTWSFVSKNKEDGFKKNERVIFNVLSHKFTQIFMTNGSVISTDTSSDTYLTGEQAMIFTLKNSSNKLLEMEMESDSRYKTTTSYNQQIKKLNVRLK